MRSILYFFLLLFQTVSYASSSISTGQNDFLSPDDAFKVSFSYPSNNQLLVTWDIEKDYYQKTSQQLNGKTFHISSGLGISFLDMRRQKRGRAYALLCPRSPGMHWSKCNKLWWRCNGRWWDLRILIWLSKARNYQIFENVIFA